MLSNTSRLFLTFFLTFQALGFYFTHSGMETWDSASHLNQSQWLIHRFFFTPFVTPEVGVTWYGPLWETVLGIFSEILFRGLHDPTWIRYSINFTLLPITLFFTFKMLRRADYSKGTAFLAVVLLLGCIRLGGHSILNTKDFPLACAYLLVSLYFWIFLTELRNKSIHDPLSRKEVLIGSGLAVVPYLVRPPMIFHILLWLTWCFSRTLMMPSRSKKGIAKEILKPILAMVFWFYLLWPTLWTASPRNIIDSIRKFSHFPVGGLTRVFSETYDVQHLPIWYPYAWIPVILHPFTFALLILGLGLCLFPGAPFLKGTGVQFKSIKLSLKSWLALCFALPCLAILIKHPVFYDEERHVLFLFPILLVLGALGFEKIKGSWKLSMGALSLILSGMTYAQWGRYSYIYQSPLVGHTLFTGDYWAVCTSDMINELPHYVPEGARIGYLMPPPIVRLQLNRLHNSTYPPLKNFPDYSFEELDPSHYMPPENGYVLSLNRFDRGEIERADLNSGRAKQVFALTLPTKETACRLLYYPKLSKP